MLVFQDERLYPLGTLTQIFSQIRIPENLPLDMCSPLEVEPSVGGVSSSLALQTLPWRSSTLQLLEQ